MKTIQPKKSGIIIENKGFWKTIWLFYSKIAIFVTLVVFESNFLI